PEADRETMMDNISALTVESPIHSHEHSVISPNGDIRWQRWTNLARFDAQGKAVGYQAIGEDITERKRTEHALQESEERFRLAFLTSPDAINLNRADDGMYIDINEGFTNIMGYTREDVIGNTSLSLNIWKNLEDRKRLIHGLSKTGYVENLEARFVGKDGKIRVGLMSARILRIGDEGVILSITRDITKHKKAEAALRESEEKFRTLVEESPLGISLIGKGGRYKYVNPRFQEMFGYTIDDVPTGKEWFRKAYPDGAYRRAVVRSWLGGLRQTGVWQSRLHIYTVTCKDGSLKEIHFRPVTMENLDRFVIYEDITERTEMERMLQQSQKFEAIGTLAGGIAHDFNNLLMGIQGRASLMSVDLEPSHPHSEHINAIQDYIRSATDLTKQLLGFSRGGKYEVRPIDINELLLKSATMFGRTKKEIRIHTKLQNLPPVVAADQSQIEQVLLNLYVNAWQAMPDGGEIYLETKIVTLDDAYCESYQAKPGRYAKVAVTDTGIGMDESIRRRIFDPFFTTKEKGRGTGLGLASAYGIIKNHAGIITVYSEVGHGTTFNIYLPVSDKAVYRDVPTGSGLAKGSETVLMVDDEEMIVEVGQAMLEKLGYRVVVAKSGEHAVDTITKKGHGIDLVILDLIMPGIDGGKAFDLIREIYPEMPVMLSTGYSLNGQADGIMRRGCNEFIQKPFNISELSQKVRKILNEAKDPAKE
ncbi:MAG: PAS domain S-box protein, partial [Deltaproteobacteria bacterium]|nr:PAS domain S-box protein [Deltaproteobacteria bacterium]